LQLAEKASSNAEEPVDEGGEVEIMFDNPDVRELVEKMQRS